MDGLIVGARLSVALVFIVLLSACSTDPTPHAFNDYQQRLARSLQQPVVDVVRLPVSSYPPIRQLRSPNHPSQHIDLMDLLALDACALGQVIAKRHSSLGKVSRPSQQLIYELSFLQHAPACIDYLESVGDFELAKNLQQAFDEKQQHVVSYIWHGLFTGQEFRAFWQQPHYLADYPDQANSDVIANLQLLNRWVANWLGGDYRVDPKQLEWLLASVGKGDGGALFKALHVQASALYKANQSIQQRQLRPVCVGGHPNPQANIVKNVVSRFWLQGLQSWSANINQRYYQLLPAVQHLEEQLAAAEPPAYRRWREQRDQWLQAWQQAPKQHVEHLQGIYQQCGWLPSQAS